MTDQDIRSEKELLLSQYLTASERLAAMYVRAGRIGRALQAYGRHMEGVGNETENALPRFKEIPIAHGMSDEGLDLDHLQTLMDKIAAERSTLERIRADMRRMGMPPPSGSSTEP